MNILIIGGTGGIGSALITQCLTTYPQCFVHATYRNQPPATSNQRIRWHHLDATNEREIQSLANQLPNINILIVAIGLLTSSTHAPEKSIREFDVDFFKHNFEANTLPTLYLAKHFSTKLKSKQPSYFITLSARIGSIEDNHLGGWVSYRCSKAALNMAIKTISVEWKRKLTNCCIFAFHPGTTDTALSQPFQKNIAKEKLFSAQYVAQCLLTIIAQIGPDDSGQFLSYDGSQIPW